MGSRFIPAANADARRATSRQHPPRRLRSANGPLARISRNARADLATDRIACVGAGSGYVCTLAGRLNDALLHNEAITDKALRQVTRVGPSRRGCPMARIALWRGIARIVRTDSTRRGCHRTHAHRRGRDLRRKSEARRNFLFGPSLSRWTKGEDKS
jgi:hypothetical protein